MDRNVRMANSGRGSNFNSWAFQHTGCRARPRECAAKGEFEMKKIAMMMLATSALLTGVGCAAQHKGPEVAEYGTSRTDAQQGEPEQPQRGREFWTKMR